jgi:hypothetical protein
MTKVIDNLIQTICGSSDHPLAPFLERWCAESRPFIGFLQRYATKIHKKARLATDDDLLDDLLAELAMVVVLVRDRRCSVAYEHRMAKQMRGPDITVTFKTHTLFNVEVTRLRTPSTFVDNTPDASLKLARILCSKIGQFPPGCMNALAIMTQSGSLNDALIPATMALLDRYAQRQDATLFVEGRLNDIQTYLRQRQRLSAILHHSFDSDWMLTSTTYWLNPQARHPLRHEIVQILTAH